MWGGKIPPVFKFFRTKNLNTGVCVCMCAFLGNSLDFFTPIQSSLDYPKLPRHPLSLPPSIHPSLPLSLSLSVSFSLSLSLTLTHTLTCVRECVKRTENCKTVKLTRLFFNVSRYAVVGLLNNLFRRLNAARPHSHSRKQFLWNRSCCVVLSGSQTLSDLENISYISCYAVLISLPRILPVDDV